MANVFRRLSLSQWPFVQCQRLSLVRQFSTTSSRNVIIPIAGKNKNLKKVRTHMTRFDKADVSDFRELAFGPEKPLLFSAGDDKTVYKSFPIPAAYKWFTRRPQKNGKDKGELRTALNYKYLDQFGDHVFNMEATVSTGFRQEEKERFFQLQAPLHVMMSTARLEKAAGGTRYRILRYYLAQTQLIDLPKGMQDDIETPYLVTDVGKGDIYDTNVWIGQPPTYTPLHRDPNPNLFVQIASTKIVRIYEPHIGGEIFRKVQTTLGNTNASPIFRGEEMMQGPEREELELTVWGPSAPSPGYEVIVMAGDALFIPKGWWHSVKSVGPDINASVNWWFR